MQELWYYIYDRKGLKMNNETINETQNNVENLDITPPLVPNQNIEVYKPYLEYF